MNKAFKQQFAGIYLHQLHPNLTACGPFWSQSWPWHAPPTRNETNSDKLKISSARILHNWV